MAKYLDDNGLLYFWQKIKSVFATQADLNTLSDTVDGIVSEGGEPNRINTVKVNGSALTPDANKAVNVTVAQGSANGTLAVNGTDVSVKGLGSAAYTASSDYDASGSAAAVLGASTDAASANTVYGAKKAAAAAQSDVDALEELVGSTAVATQIANAIGGLDSSITAETGKGIASITITDGKITAHTKTTFLTQHQDISGKANLASPTFTGTPAAPTATAGTNTTQIATTAFVTTAVANAIAGIQGITYEIVQALPATGEAGVIYLVAHSHGTGDIYDEYIWTGTAFEKIGNTDIDLSGYWAKADLVAITNAEIDTILAA